MTGRQLVRFLCELRGQPVNGDLDDLARRFDIDLDRPIANLSSGMKRKVALLQVLAPHARWSSWTSRPTPSTRPCATSCSNRCAQARDRGQAVLFSSHVLSEVERVCDRVAILRGGRLVHLQNMAELREGRLVQARFERPLARRRRRCEACTSASTKRIG